MSSPTGRNPSSPVMQSLRPEGGMGAAYMASFRESMAAMGEHLDRLSEEVARCVDSMTLTRLPVPYWREVVVSKGVPFGRVVMRNGRRYHVTKGWR